MVDHSGQTSLPQSSRQAAADGERIAKALARAGVASRRDVERLIEERRVAINGVVVESPAVKVGAGDILTVDGAVIGAAEPTRLWRYHKPSGLVTSHKDPQGRATVFEHLPDGMPRVISVGRLDLNSEGLLLLTNDGALSRALELPSSGWIRRYRARAYGHTSQEKLDRLKAGVTVEGVHYGPIEAKLDKASPSKEGEKGPANLWITVSLAEGKNREVRRVLESIGLKVNRLIRLAYGPFALGTLGPGEVEEIGPRVIREQLEGFVAPENMPKGDRRPLALGPPKVNRRAQTKAAQHREERGPSGAPTRPAAAKARPQARPVDRPAEEPKKVYKAGWAKPKPKSNPHPVKLKAKAAVNPDAPRRKPPAPKPRGTDLTLRPTGRSPRKGR